MNETPSIKKNGFFNVLRQFCAIAFPLITYPYVARVLGTVGLGKVNFVSSVVSYYALLAALGISTYAIREGARIRNDKKKINNFVNEIYTINIISTIVAYVLLIITYFIWSRLQNYKVLLLIQSLSILFTTIGVDWLYQIFEKYVYIAIRSFIIQIVSILLMFIFVRTPNDYVIYTGITVFANGGASIFNYAIAKKQIKFHLTIHPNIKKHIIPLIILFFNSIVVTIYVSSDTTMLGIMKGDSAVGIYNVAVKIYTMLKYLISSLIAVFIPRLSLYSSSDKEKSSQLTSKLLNILFFITLPLCAGLFIISDETILIVGGASFASGALSLRILSISIFFSMLSTFFTNAVLLPFKDEKEILVATTVSSILNLSLNFIFIPRWSYNGAAFTTLLAELTVAVLGYIFSKKFVDLKIQSFDLLSEILGCAGIVLVCCVSKMFISKLYIRTAVEIIFSIAVYVIILLITKNTISLNLINDIKKRLKKD